MGYVPPTLVACALLILYAYLKNYQLLVGPHALDLRRLWRKPLIISWRSVTELRSAPPADLAKAQPHRWRRLRIDYADAKGQWSYVELRFLSLASPQALEQLVSHVHGRVAEFRAKQNP